MPPASGSTVCRTSTFVRRRTGMIKSEALRAGILSLTFLLVLLGVWHVATLPKEQAASANDEYARLMGKGAVKTTGFPTPAQMGETALKHLSDPFYDKGPNDKGIGIQLGFSLARVGLGFVLAALLAIPLGFVIGMSPLIYRALDPFIQVLKPISPLAWMPLALYTIKDSSISGIFVIFICSVWPMLISTAFGVAAVRREWLNVARTLEVNPVRKALQVILPAAAPTIMTGMRISMGIAWLVIVAAEMLVGGTGIGYFVWNEWNNLSLTNVIFAILMIGLVGMLLDLLFGRLQKLVTYAE
jgi:nitrate/nitrite transport system permease protein